MDDTLTEVEQALAYAFRDRALLLEALTHPSFSAETDPPVPENQRLEFLGDAVLQLATTDRLYRQFREVNEGRLTKLRSVLTKERTLVRFATDLGLDRALRLGKGEYRTGGRERASNLADAFEAVLGALYLDGGLAPACALCNRLVEPYLADVEKLLASENPKGALQEYTQENFRTKPAYEVLRVEGPEHEPEIEVRVCLGSRELARATAGSRRRAERLAAQSALKTLLEARDEQ
jgi:ribonuclease-3